MICCLSSLCPNNVPDADIFICLYILLDTPHIPGLHKFIHEAFHSFRGREKPHNVGEGRPSSLALTHSSLESRCAQRLWSINLIRVHSQPWFVWDCECEWQVRHWGRAFKNWQKEWQLVKVRHNDIVRLFWSCGWALRHWGYLFQTVRHSYVHA